MSLMNCSRFGSRRALRDVSHPQRASGTAPTSARLPLATNHSLGGTHGLRRSSHRAQASAVNVADYAAAPALEPTARNKTPEPVALHRAPTAPLEASSCEVTIRQFFDAFNRRDLPGMADFVADDVEHCNLAYAKPYPKGKQAVVQFYKAFMDAVPRSAQFVIEDTTGANASGTIGVIWHLDIKGTVVPNSSGVSFFRLNTENRISYVRESPEHFTKITSVALPTLSVLSPLISLAEPLISGRNNSQSTTRSQTAPSSPSTPQSTFSSNEKPPTAPQTVPANLGRLNSRAADTAATPAENDRIRGVAMRPLIPSTAAKAAAAADAGASSSTATAAVLEASEAAEHSSQSSRTPVLTSRAGADPRVHNGVAPEPQQLEPSVYSASSAEFELEGPPVDTEASQASEAAATAALPLRFAGVWQKDQPKCDRQGYERALELMGLGGIQKATALGLEGMEVQFEAVSGVFETFFLTPVPFFKVRERYLLGGAESKQSRRDLRGGQQVAKAWLKGDRVVTELAWGPQKSGTGSEEFWVDENDQLNVKSTVTVNGQSSTTLQVYSRQDEGNVDSRYYAPKREIPFGIDPNSVSEGILGNFLK